MKSYRMGHSKNLLFLGISMAVLFSTAIVIASILIGNFGCLFLIIPAIAADIWLIITIYNVSNRKQIAMNGKDAMAKISSIWNVEGIAPEYGVEYEYVTESGEDILGKAYISGKDYNYFYKYTVIPIKLNGEYAIFNAKDVIKYYKQLEKNQNKLSNESKQERVVYCKYCDSSFENYLSSCPHCGAPRSKED